MKLLLEEIKVKQSDIRDNRWLSDATCTHFICTANTF